MIRLFILCFIGLTITNPSNAKDFDFNKVEYLVETGLEQLENSESNNLSEFFIEKLKYYDAHLLQLRSSKDHKDSSESFELDELHIKLRSLLSVVDESMKPFTLVTTEVLSGNGDGIIRGRVMGQSSNNFFLRLYNSDGSYYAFTYSDDVGRYEFKNLNPGSYFVYLESYYDYVSQFNGGVLCQGGLGVGCDLGDLIPIVIDGVGDVEITNFNIIERAKITGKIKNTSGEFLTNGRVRLYNQEENQVDSSYLSDDGEYILVSPAPGSYYVKLSSGGYISELYNDQACDISECPFESAQLIVIGQTGTTVLPDVELAPYQDLSGTLMEYQTLDIIDEYTKFEIFNAENNYFVDSEYYYNGLPDDGSYKFEGIPPGQYYLKARAGNYLAQVYNFKNCRNFNIDNCDFEQLNATVVEHGSDFETKNIHFRMFQGATISGAIKDEFGSIVTDSIVRLYDENGYEINSKNPYDGYYEFSGLGNGRYYVSAYDDGFLNTLYPSIVCPDGLYYSVSSCSQATTGGQIQISALNDVVNADVTLRSGSTLNGVVIGISGQRLENSKVRLYNSNGYPYGGSISALTDSQGNYSLTGIPAGQYYLVAGASDYQVEIYSSIACFDYDECITDNAQVINVNGVSNYNNYNFSLLKNASLTVNLNNPMVQDVNGRVEVYNESGNILASDSFYDSKAEFSLPRGNYYIVFKSYDPFYSKVYGGGNCESYYSCEPLTGAKQFFNSNGNYTINMNVDRMARIHGTFAEINGGELSDAWQYIVMYQFNEEIYRRKYHSGNEDFSFYVPYTGAVKLGVEKSGYYRHFYNNVNCINDGCGLGGAATVQLAVNQEREFNFKLKPIATISGQVKNYQGEELTNNRVKLLSENGYTIQSVRTDDDGYYQFNGLNLGEHYIEVEGGEIYEGAFNGNVSCGIDCSYEDATPVNLTVNSNNVINISLKRKGVVNINEVKFLNGQVANNARISLIRIDNGQSFSLSYPDQNGSFDPAYLLPGQYVLTGRPSSNSSLTTYYNSILCEQGPSQSCQDQATVINVGYGSNININDFEINSLGKIEVNVTAETTAAPLQYQNVKVYSEDFDMVSDVESNSSGLAQISNLPTGNYYIYVENDGYGSSGYLPELYNDVNCTFGIGISCLIADGDLVSVDMNGLVQLDIGLQEKPKLKVNVTDSFTQEPLDNTRVYVFNQSGQNVSSSYEDGYHEFNLDSGSYFVTARKNYNFNQKGYPDIICSDVDDMVCDSSLQPVVFDYANGDTDIDISLDFTEGIQGFVLDSKTNAPIENIIIDSWVVDNGSYYIDEPVLSDVNGAFRSYLNQGNSYILSTDVPEGMGYTNQIHEEVYCTEGPAVIDMCDLSLGKQIIVPDTNVAPEIVVFNLFVDDIFQSSFE